MWDGKFTIYDCDWFSVTLFVEHKKSRCPGGVFDFDSRGSAMGVLAGCVGSLDQTRTLHITCWSFGAVVAVDQ